MTKEELLKEASTLQSELVAVRRELHKHPELEFDLKFTKQFIWDKLLEIGVEPVSMGKSGIIVTLGGKKPGKCILLRADMDALPILEEAEVDYKSTIEGKMHGCGHDAHTAVGVFVSRLLADNRDSLCGTYKVIFQPAEEGERGADEVIATGLVDDCDAFFGLHVWSLYETGSLHATPGGVCAEPDMFKVTIHGRGGHGATPELCIDPIAAGAAVVQSLQHIPARFISPMQSVVVTIGSFHAGTRCNIIAQDAVLEGTLRAFDDDVHRTLVEAFRRIITQVSEAHGCTADIEIN